jgi:hypothetical protein
MIEIVGLLSVSYSFHRAISSYNSCNNFNNAGNGVYFTVGCDLDKKFFYTIIFIIIVAILATALYLFIKRDKK